MSILRNRISLILGCLLVVVLFSGCVPKKLSPEMEAKYQADVTAYSDKVEKDRIRMDLAHYRWQTLLENDAPDHEIEQAHLEYLEAQQDVRNPGREPQRFDNAYDNRQYSRAGHRLAQKPATNIPPVTVPKPPKPPCKDHH